MLPPFIDANWVQSIHQDRLKEADQAQRLKIIKLQQLAQRSSSSRLRGITTTIIPGLKAHLAQLSHKFRWS